MIELVDIDHAQELDTFVMTHPHGHFMQSSVWGRVKKDWQWQGILCKNAEGNILGSMAMLRRKLRFGRSCLLYAPRGPVWEHTDKKTFCELMTAAKSLASSYGAYALRLDPPIEEGNVEFLQFASELGFSCDQASDFSLYQPRMCYVLDLCDLTPQSLAAQYHSKTRYNIHLALRNDVAVRYGSAEDLPIFCEMMAQTAAKNQFVMRERTYFQAVLQHTGGKLYLAEYEGRAIAGAISLIFGKQASFLYGCSFADSLKLHPNELLQWYMQSDAIRAGCRSFDLRGVEGYPIETNLKFGLHRYKRGFGAQFTAYIGQLDMVLKPYLNKLLQLYTNLH